MDNQTFVYVTYIRTTPEKLWEALTSQVFTQQYWDQGCYTTDWKVGSPISFVGKNGAMNGTILKYDPPKCLSYTWQSKTLPEPTASKVEFKIEHVGPTVKLTIVHDELSEKMRNAISGGWPAIMASLKSLLESGSPLVYERWF